MPVATAAQVLDSARAHLDDFQGTLWTDPRLLPMLQEAHRELQAKLLLNGLQIMNEVTPVLTVPALTTNFSLVTGYPTDLVEPIWMKERQVGQLNEDFADMQEVDFIPNVRQSTELVWWCWQEEKIIFLGATNNVEVQLRYRRYLTTPLTVNDTIGVLLGENHLSYRTASLASNSVGRPRKDLEGAAQSNLDIVIRAAVKELQNLPAKRRPYHRGRGRNRVLRDA
jgi:hypothetical protein